MERYHVVFVSPNREMYRAKSGVMKRKFPDQPLIETVSNSFFGAARRADSLNNETKGCFGYYRAAKIN
jgi:hypothetical protein